LGHDLRNPLSAVRASAGLLLRRQDLPRDVRQVLLRTDHAARRMAEMIGTLLDVTEIRSKGTLPLSRAPTDLSEVCRRVIEELLAASPERVIVLDLRGSGHGEWDGARLAQVVSNLVSNALTHGSDGEPVRVTIDGDASGVVLRVKNSGPVIPREAVPTL